MFEYDVAISFAGEQRPEAEAIAGCLRSAGIKVFYDAYEQANLWGKDLYEHLSDIYQNKARYCLMLVSESYAARVWTTHERRSAQARALSQSPEYILPVRFDDTEIPGLPITIGYLRFNEHSAEGICRQLLKKLDSAPQRSVMPTPQAVTPVSSDFWTQRKRLRIPEILNKIWSKPNWCIWIRPTEFKKARFRDLEQCRAFINSSYVRVQGWFPYPSFSPAALENGDEWITGEMDQSDGRFSRVELWALFRSAQFVHNLAFNEIADLGDRIHVLEILDTATAAFEFAARMAQRGLMSPEVVLSFELKGLDGRTLTWPQDVFGRSDAIVDDCWCQDETFGLTRQSTVTHLEAANRGLALDVALEIYSKFGWSNPPRDRLAEQQEKRFGPPRS